MPTTSLSLVSPTDQGKSPTANGIDVSVRKSLEETTAQVCGNRRERRLSGSRAEGLVDAELLGVIGSVN